MWVNLGPFPHKDFSLKCAQPLNLFCMVGKRQNCVVSHVPHSPPSVFYVLLLKETKLFGNLFQTRFFSLMYISDAAACWVLYIKHIWWFKFTFRNSLFCFVILVVSLSFFFFALNHEFTFYTSCPFKECRPLLPSSIVYLVLSGNTLIFIASSLLSASLGCLWHCK